MAKGKGGGGSYRRAISGRYVTAARSKRSPSAMVREADGGGSTGGTYRSTISGRFVTTAHRKRSPEPTIKDS